MPVIRPVATGDFPGLLRLYAQLNPEDPLDPDTLHVPFETILESPHFHLLVAEAQGVLVGSCYLNVVPNLSRGGRPYALIENVITAATHRRRGTGKALLGMAEALARQAGCYKLMLLSGRRDPGVRAFYVACGYSADAKQAYLKRLV